MSALVGPVNGHARRVKPDPRVLPHNLDAEASILGGVILRNEVLARLDSLEVDHFYDMRHKIVFSAIRALEAAAKPIDCVTLEGEIERQGKLDAVGGIAFLGDLALRVPTPDNVVAYHDHVRLLARNRQAILMLSDALHRAQSSAYEPHELVSETAGELQRLDVDGASRDIKTRWCQPLADYLGDGEPDDDDAEDWIIRDMIPRGEPALWGGPMKGGKTWGALDLCIACALGEAWLGRFEFTPGKPIRVLGIFLEDSKRRLRKRLWELARARNITPNHPTLRDHLRISRATLRLPDAADQRRLIAEIKAWGATLVVIDNLTRVMVGDPNSTREAAAFTKAWTEIGDATGASVVFLHHTRKVSGDAKHAVDPFDALRGSGDFGATARNIIVTTPIRTESTAKLSEVRMRGNLDLRCESFTLGFERSELLGKWRAKLVDKGEIDDVRSDVRKESKAAKETARRAEVAAELEVRRNRAIEIARREGSVSQAQLAKEFGLKSGRTFADLLTDLVRSEILVKHPRMGYVLADADRQEQLT